MQTKSLCLLLLLVAVNIVLVQAGGSCRWCSDITGKTCNTGGVASTEATTVEDEEVMENFESEASVLHESNAECKSSCDWIKTREYSCTSCAYPWAFYKSKDSPAGCINHQNALQIMQQSPESVSRYSKLCENNGKCNCKQTTYFFGRGGMRVSHDNRYCRYMCSSVQIAVPSAGRGSAPYAGPISTTLNQMVVTLARDMLNGQCPTATTVASFKGGLGVQQQAQLTLGAALKSYCKYVAAEAALRQFANNANYVRQITLWRDSKN